MSQEEEFLDSDNPIPGQNFACLSFLSPDELIKSKELFMFSRYMNQKYAEWDKVIDEVMEKSEDKLKNKIQRDIKEKLRLELKYNYDQFKDSFDNFTYKFNDELNKEFNEISDYRTNMRGVKIRGVYETMKEAEIKAKQLQKRDRSFHVFVGSVGQWLPWDPCADRVQNEEYLEDELNNLMKEYKKNEVNKNLFYEEQKREKMQDSIKEKLKAEEERKNQEEENKKHMETIEQNLESEDPWLQNKERQEEPKITEIQNAAETNESKVTPSNESN